MTPCEVDKAFHDFWSPFWNRDKVSALASDDEWHDILEILDGLGEQDDIMEIKLDDPEIWYKTIHKLKPNKSTGYDGWTAEDLQILPYSAVKHLCQISQKLWTKGFSVPFMQARTVLLAKIECVQHMGHCRPITILGQLYRLTTKIIADQILGKWAYTMPSNISGGLPGRGSRLLMYAHQANIETAISSQSCLGGFVLDLVKAFNCIPRRPLAHMMVKKGIPIKIVKFWMSSLQNLSRLSQVGDNLGQPLFSTTGVPEGDAMSVCGMICLASCYHDYVNMNLDDITVNIYADNWGWATPRPYSRWTNYSNPGQLYPPRPPNFKVVVFFQGLRRVDKTNQTPQHDISRTHSLTLTFGEGGVFQSFPRGLNILSIYGPGR